MAKKFFSNIYYRAAGAIASTLTKGGSYPAYTIAGWTALVGAQSESKVSEEPDGDEAVDGGATTYTSGMKAPLEITVKDFTAANYATIRAAFMNVKVDVLLVDADQPGVGYAVFGTRLSPSTDFTSAAEPKIVLKGERKYGSSVSSAPFQLITIS